MSQILTHTVKSILQNDPQCRDSDARLRRAVYKTKVNIAMVTYDHVFQLEESGELPSSESIRRTRQKIQEHHPELRGDIYNKRQEAGEEVRDTVNTSFNQSTMMFE